MPRFSLYGVPVVVLAVGLLITAVLALTARSVHSGNENRLLRQRVNEAAAVLAAAIPNTQTPLASASTLVEATHGDRQTFRNFMAQLAAGRPFVSASLWRTGATDPTPLITVGNASELATRPPAEIVSYLARTSSSKTVAVLDLLGAPQRRLGYGFSGGKGSDYVVYAEAALPANRRANVDTNSAFADLDYAIYLGARADPNQLLAASVADPAFRGRNAADTVAFGDSQLHIVMTPRRELGGDLLARLPWLIGGIGIVLALAATFLTERLVRRRAYAEVLAQQNARLFSEQRSVAQTLQHALLPGTLPVFAGLDLAVRYVPGVDGVDIGGDWYDVIAVGDGKVMLIVGDVSGRGLRAATVMAALRYAIRAYAADGDSPETILRKLSKLIDVGDGHFATVLCGVVDVPERRITLANAGHPSPLLITGSSAELVATKVGVPVGVEGEGYATVTVAIPPDAILMAYTDGLFERRGESPDVGLARLRDASIGYESLSDLLDGVLHTLTPDGGNDDTAILAVTWNP
jgi:serine phosphatase RsbU (regulator of sigma subunit)